MSRPMGLIARAEREIAAKTIEVLLAAGYRLSVWNGEDEEIRLSTDPVAILAAMKQTDEDYLWVFRGSRADCRCGEEPTRHNGWVRFVYGNDGWDVINDYTTNLEAILEPVNRMAEEMAG